MILKGRRSCWRPWGPGLQHSYTSRKGFDQPCLQLHFPPASFSVIHSLWAAKARRCRLFFFFQLRLASLKQGCPFTRPGVNLWSWIYRDDLFVDLDSFQLQPFVLHDLLSHAYTYTSVLFYVRVGAGGRSGWLFGVFKCVTNNMESKQKNVFGTGTPLTCAILIQWWFMVCLSFWFFSLLLKVRRCVKLNAPDNGYIKCSGDGNNYGATCEFSCIGGYELQGSPARVCQYNLGWSGVEPTCARKWVFHHSARRNPAQWFWGQWEFRKGVWGGIQLQCPRDRKFNIIFACPASLHLWLKPLPPLTALAWSSSSKLSTKCHILESFHCAS